MFNLEKFSNQNNTISNFNLSISYSGILTSDDRWNYANITSPYNRLYFMLDGQAFIKAGEKYVPLVKNHCYLIPAGMTCDYNCNKEFSKFFLHINVEIVDGVDIFDGLDNIISIKYDKEETEKIISLIRQNDVYSCACVKSELYSIIAQLIKKANISIDQRMASKYKDFFEYVSKNISANLQIKDIANALYMTPQTLSKAFKRDMNMSLKRQIEIILLKKLKRLLVDTDYSIKEIAEILHFSDQFYLSRFFKKIEGISPSEYRQNNKLIG